MTPKISFISDFHRSRSRKLGASDIAACIQHPERYESLAGYGRTALTVWEEKTGRRERDPAGFAAEMGNVLEPVVLRKWIRENDSPATADRFYRGYVLCELDKQVDGYPDAASFQNTNYLHHTRAETDYAISHVDLLRMPEKNGPETHAIIEAKTASFWSARRRDDPYNGYDPELSGHQGIPLRNYFQVLFQAAIYGEAYSLRFDELSLALLFDTSRFCQWSIRVDTRVQERLLEVAHYMKQCIDRDVPPKELAMNQSDIKAMYPRLNEDFRIVSGDELTAATNAALQAREAAQQAAAWKLKKEDAENALAVLLKDVKVLRGLVDGDIVDIAAWEERKGSERVAGVKEIKKDAEFYRMAVERGFVKVGEPSRFVKTKLKIDEVE
jgi:ferredoxin-fold anticodon binding domain-containing protein